MASPEQTSFENDLAICQSVTRAGGSNLALVSKGLKQPLQHLFAPSYASMRLIDDMVDERFLALDQAHKENERQDYLARIDAWEEVSIQAAQGKFKEPDYQFKLPKDQASAIFRMLSLTLGKSNLGDTPWRAMASAMRRDVREQNIKDWDDFADYGWGATVSPTAVYLYILTCRFDKETGIYDGIQGSELMELAKPIGLFCYLVHIARDLKKDAAKADQLLTIPEPLQQELRSDASDPVRLNIVQEILAQASKLSDECDKISDEVISQMSMSNKLIYKSLFGLYRSMFFKMLKDPTVSFDASFEKDTRSEDPLFAAQNET